MDRQLSIIIVAGGLVGVGGYLLREAIRTGVTHTRFMVIRRTDDPEIYWLLITLGGLSVAGMAALLMMATFSKIGLANWISN